MVNLTYTFRSLSILMVSTLVLLTPMSASAAIPTTLDYYRSNLGYSYDSIYAQPSYNFIPMPAGAVFPYQSYSSYNPRILDLPFWNSVYPSYYPTSANFNSFNSPVYNTLPAYNNYFTPPFSLNYNSPYPTYSMTPIVTNPYQPSPYSALTTTPLSCTVSCTSTVNNAWTSGWYTPSYNSNSYSWPASSCTTTTTVTCSCTCSYSYTTYR